MSTKGDNKRKFSKRSQIFFHIKMEIFKKTLLRYISNRRAHEMKNIPYIGVCNFFMSCYCYHKTIKEYGYRGKESM